MESALKETGYELCIVVPVFNERDNVLPMVRELSEVLANIEWETIFVDDDSPDGTAAAVREVAITNPRVRCLKRIGRRGLSSASVEGMLATAAPYVAVIDGDLQHDSSILVQMLDTLKSSDSEIVVGSRYVDGGGAGGLDEGREKISRFATRLGHSVVPDTLKDPMSGFFMLRRSLLDDVVRNLSGLGFKILLDIFASAGRPLKFREVPYSFRSRQAGSSKLDSNVAFEYLMLLADKLVGRYVPVRFLTFAVIGGFGVVIHLAIVTALFDFVKLQFTSAQAIATCITMVFNYGLNNVLTYRDMRRRGWKWLTGLLSFLLVCSVGAFANVGVAAYLFNRRSEWVLAAIGGVLVGAVWNYAVSSVYTWGRPKRS